MSESCNLTNLQSIPLTPTAQEAYKPTVYESALPQNVERPSYRNRMILTDLTVDIPESHRVPKDAPATPPKARWGTLEFRTYIAVACVMIPVMTWIPISLSLESHPNYKFYERRLSPGWIPFRKVDNSDAQYRSFRNNFWLLTTLATAYLSIKYLWKRLGTAPPQDNTYLIRYNLFFSVFFLLGLHGTSFFKILIILSLNYSIARFCGDRKIGPVLTWVFNAAVLFANDRFNGYRYGDLLPSLEVLDGYQGAYSRWHIVYNLTMLRLVSFNIDYYWACNTSTSKEHNRNRTMTYAERMFPHPPQMYTFLSYLSYALYPPLYLAGPIMTFNDYLWQHRQSMNISGCAKVLYCIRLIASVLTMELILHFMYVVAIKDTSAWDSATPAQISMIGFWNLIIVWLKLLIPWRFFRLWALMDGIEVPENMVRCMANNYSTLGFWRSWHRSYNLWIIRYIYIPLGGSKHVLLNMLLVFTFVALWHDLTFRLLAWGWLVSLFVVPEVLAMYLLPASKYGSEPWYRHVCAAGGVLNVLMMMSANLVGFVVGTDGVGFFVQQLFGTGKGLAFLAVACAVLFVGVQLMFEYREEEKRKGIYRRC
ncbi:hypothetical protein H2248_008848 [Termitomyces sp. 'cryptogamus']|nr:hypothetical protein H2248_008848 [Termitomyces sp. 'cryptogamus']